MKLFKLGITATLLGLAFTAIESNAEDYLIKNATVHTATAKGTLDEVDVLVRDGKILQVAKDISAPDNVMLIDGSHKHLTPGLINASTNMGLVEIDAVSDTVDAVTTLEGMGASFNISPAINFRSTLIPQNRINGLTRAIVMPQTGESLFAGQGAAIALLSSMDGLLNKNVAEFAVYGERGAGIAGGSRASAMQLLEQALTDANYLRQHENRYLPGYHWEFSQSLADLQALYPVLDGNTPLVVTAHRVDDIERLIALANKHHIKLVISGGGEAWMVADKLAAARVPVIIDPIENLPQFESLAVKFEGAAILYKAGVKVLFTGGGSHNGHLVRQSAGIAAAYGMPADAALEAMTINTAEVFGIKNYGQIASGMDADLVLWDGDPLELTTNPDMVLIQGKKQPMVSRATRLRDRYWELKDIHLEAYQK